MSWRAGITGLPNGGKTVLFTALTSGGAEVAPYLFCAINPEVMPCAALNELGSRSRLKETGLLKVAGRDYLPADRGILRFCFQR
jgi:ribosome-binding ATPase YchF (GTP1/OBG family)